MANVKLLITDVESYESRPFGPSGTNHFSFIVSEPLGNETMVAFLSENLLRKAGISTEELDSIIGSHLNLMDSKDLAGIVTTAEERIDDVLDGTRQFLLVSQANGGIIRSELLKEEKKRQATDIKAKIAVEKEKEREHAKKVSAMKAMLERRNASSGNAPQLPQTPETPKTEDSPKQEEPSLETNTDEPPF